MTQRQRPQEMVNVPVIFTANFGRLLFPVATFSIFRSVSIPSVTRPKTVCFPSKKAAGAVVMKNFVGSSSGQFVPLRVKEV